MPAAEDGSPALQSTMLGAVSPERTAPREGDPVANPGSGSDANPSSPPKKPDPKLCGVCGTQPGKYKCPRCSMTYCSVACNKQHKENHPPDAPKPEPLPTTQPQPHPAQDDPYSILLEHRDEFKHLLARYPSLATELVRIQETTLPPADNPGPSFWSSAITANTGRNRQQPWSKDVGLRKGAEALRKARTDPTDTGDGVREFCDLVKFLLNKKSVGIDRVREEVAAEEAKYIERLLREEGG